MPAAFRIGVDLVHNAGVAGGLLSYVYALAVSTTLIFGLVWCLYNLLTNAALTWKETFPGALFATIVLQDPAFRNSAARR